MRRDFLSAKAFVFAVCLCIRGRLECSMERDLEHLIFSFQVRVLYRKDTRRNMTKFCIRALLIVQKLQNDPI